MITPSKQRVNKKFKDEFRKYHYMSHNIIIEELYDYTQELKAEFESNWDIYKTQTITLEGEYAFFLLEKALINDPSIFEDDIVKRL